MGDVVSWGIALIGCGIGVWGWFHNRDTKRDADATWRGEINAKLDTVINQGAKITELSGKYEKLNERVIIVERDCKSAHKRIDRGEGKVGT